MLHAESAGRGKPKARWAQAKGFSLYRLKAILNGRGNEVVELVNTNLR